MTVFDGVLYDGSRAGGARVRVEAKGREITIALVDAAAEPRRLGLDDIAIDSPIPGVARRLRLAGGELIETSDHAAVATLWPARGAAERVAYALESHWWTAMASLALAAAIVWLVVAYALPLAADPAARLVSPKIEDFMGKQALATLDRIAFKPSALPVEEQERLAEAFDEFVADERDGNRYGLEFRRAGAPNAFALPGGTIVVTDEMVRLTASDAEFLAVTAHEIGHVRGRHALRLVLQDSGLAVLMTVLAGDAVGTTILAAALPSVLLRTRYSRRFETEADDYAFAMLARHGQSPQAFADLMRRLQQRKHEPLESDSTMQYLSAHPATDERIRRAEEYR